MKKENKNVEKDKFEMILDGFKNDETLAKRL